MAFSAVTAVVASFANASQRAAEKAREASDAAAETSRANQEQRDSYKALFERLEELNEKSALTNAEFVEAKGIIAQLTGAYGDLGFTLDETAKKFGGLAEAQAAFNKKQREQRKADLASEDAALNAELEQLAKRRDNLIGDWTVGGVWAGVKDALGMQGGTEEQIVEINNREAEIRRKLAANKLEAEGLKIQEDSAEAAEEERKASETQGRTATEAKDSEDSEDFEKEVEKARETAASFETDALSEFDEKRAEIAKKYADYVAAQDSILNDAMQNGNGSLANETYAANLAKADAWRETELGKVQIEEDVKRRQVVRTIDDVTADSEVVKARFAVLQAMNGGGNVSAAMEAFNAAQRERENSRREDAQFDVEDAMTRFANAQIRLNEAQKSGDKSRIEAAEEESVNAAQELASANSTLDEIIRGSLETAQKMQPQLSSQGTFNAWEAGDFAQTSPELEEMKRQTKILDRLERKFVFTGDDTRL